MKVFQLIISVIAALMTISMFAFNIWVNKKFMVSASAKCYMPMNIITAILVLIAIIMIFLKK